MKCPACGTEGAYVGITLVECINISCKHFSAKQIEKTETLEIKVDCEDCEEDGCDECGCEDCCCE
jgi:hypothetical protein